jgi:mRNA-degrading endonuclease toxin of MazEF toxin-antitoxin module
MPYTPDRGDIVHVQFDPASGQEMKVPSTILDDVAARIEAILFE